MDEATQQRRAGRNERDRRVDWSERRTPPRRSYRLWTGFPPSKSGSTRRPRRSGKPNGRKKKDPREDVVAASVAVDRARADLEAATGMLMREAQAFSAESGCIGRLVRFIRERASDGTYGRHLGLVATVRKDFEQLAGLMTPNVDTNDIINARKQHETAVRDLVRRAGLNPDELVPQTRTETNAGEPGQTGGDLAEQARTAQANAAEKVQTGGAPGTNAPRTNAPETNAPETTPKPIAEETPAVDAGPLLNRERGNATAGIRAFSALDTDAAVKGRFDRIILYIDDLDRCEPEQVVAVLQAVHMLLFFPLFAVFVAG